MIQYKRLNANCVCVCVCVIVIVIVIVCVCVSGGARVIYLGGGGDHEVCV